MKNRYLSALWVVLVILAVSACSTGPRVTTDYDAAFNFTKVERIAFEPFQASGDGILLSDMQKNRLRDTLAAGLTARGYTIVAPNQAPDLLLNWHLVTTERSEMRAHNTGPAFYCWYCGPWMNTQVLVNEYTEGTHIIDMIDPQKKEGVWRAVVSTPLSVHSSAERMDARLQAVGQALLKDFPVRGGYSQPAKAI